MKNKAVSKKPDMSADTPVRGQGVRRQGCPRTGPGVCEQVFRIDKQFPNFLTSLDRTPFVLVGETNKTANVK